MNGDRVKIERQTYSEDQCSIFQSTCPTDGREADWQTSTDTDRKKVAVTDTSKVETERHERYVEK